MRIFKTYLFTLIGVLPFLATNYAMANAVPTCKSETQDKIRALEDNHPDYQYRPKVKEAISDYLYTACVYEIGTEGGFTCVENGNTAVFGQSKYIHLNTSLSIWFETSMQDGWADPIVKRYEFFSNPNRLNQFNLEFGFNLYIDQNANNNKYSGVKIDNRTARRSFNNITCYDVDALIL